MGNTIIFVTHNPELTRYATRVVYMHDGMIIQDEETDVGQVAKTARRQLYNIPTKTEEDDLAGVSLLMNMRPDYQNKTEGKSKSKKRSKAAARKRRS